MIMITSSLSVLMAQAPQLINYQAIARNSASGAELANQAVFVSLKILDGGPGGSISYQENHDNIQTNLYGLFNLSIGGGSPVTGNFANIDWANGNYWLQIDIDAGDGMETMGSMQFVSVPYALHAQTASNVDDADSDPENELVTGIEFDAETNIFSLIQPGSILTQDLSSLLNDADSDPENELVSDIQFDSATSTFSLVQASGTLTQDLSSLINDADSDPLNEAITSVTLSGTNLVISEVSDFTVSLSQLVNDADADPENEKISLLELVNDTIFRIHEGDEIYEVDFGTLKRDLDWRTSEDGQVISNYGSRVGIGTNSPTSTLDINGSIGYKTTILTNLAGAVNYEVTATDHIVICTMIPSNSSTITITMPPAATCEGRSITIRKTGPVPIIGFVNVDFGSDFLDYDSGTDTMQAFNRETVTYISLGNSGWTRIYTD